MKWQQIDADTSWKILTVRGKKIYRVVVQENGKTVAFHDFATKGAARAAGYAI